jgi:hypothetical protein
VELKFLTPAAMQGDTRSMTTLAKPEQIPIDQRAIDELVTTPRGEIIRLGDGGYEQHRRVWNGSIDRQPALIVRCASVADVRSATVSRGLMASSSRYAAEATAFLATPSVTAAW